MTDHAVSPDAVLDTLSQELPPDLRNHVVIVGSLAAAYHFRVEIRGPIRTKDADLAIRPAGAIDKCEHIAQRLLTDGWRRTKDCVPRSTANHPELRAIRLNPPEHENYYAELLGLPSKGQTESKLWEPCRLDDGWYGIPCFRYLGLADHHRQKSEAGLAYASPAMMALANLLSHPTVGDEVMLAPIGGRTIRRAAKDLGRVLALSFLAGREVVETWPSLWVAALRAEFSDDCSELARRSGDGLRALLQAPDALEEARHAVDIGLLNGRGITVEQLEATGARFIADAVEPLSKLFKYEHRTR